MEFRAIFVSLHVYFFVAVFLLTPFIFNVVYSDDVTIICQGYQIFSIDAIGGYMLQ